jgi:TetR/AcrR family transcriptional repressor of mexJK operon
MNEATPTPPSKQEAILDAATRAFLARGYVGASMDAIAEAAPVSKPTLYSHFHNKQALFAAVIARRCETLLCALSRAQTERLGVEACLTAMARSFVDFIYLEDNLNLHRLIIAEHHAFPELGELVYRSGPQPVLSQLAAYLESLNEQGLLRLPDVDRAAHLFLGMLKGYEYLRCLLGIQQGLSEAEKTALVEAVVSLFIRGHRHAD